MYIDIMIADILIIIGCSAVGTVIGLHAIKKWYDL